MNFKDINLDEDNASLVLQYFSQKKIDKMWKLVESLCSEVETAKDSELIFGKNTVTIRLWQI